MKLTLQNANKPFNGSVIEICNLVAGRERFRIQTVPLMGRILWDDSTMIEVERPFDGDKLFTETGVAIDLAWYDGESASKTLGTIYIGSKWTGPIAIMNLGSGRSYPAFSNGDYADNHASGGTWSSVPSLGIHCTQAREGFNSLQEALDYRFDHRNLRLWGRDRLFTESRELHTHIREVLRELGLLPTLINVYESTESNQENSI